MDENEREAILQWIRQCNLGFELLPLFSNQESDCVAIYTSGFLKGKVAIVRHDEAVFAPQFKSLDSFLKAYEKVAKQTDFYDWEDIEKEDSYLRQGDLLTITDEMSCTTESLS